MTNLCKCSDYSICSPEWEFGLCRKDLEYLNTLSLEDKLKLAKELHASKPQDDYRIGVIAGLTIALNLTQSSKGRV